MKFIFDSHLDDDNYIESGSEGEKPTVRVKPNPSGSQLWDEVAGLRNRILEFLHVPVHYPNDYMHFGNEGTVHHAGGTLRMSADGSGVVDQDLKFLAYDNLYACDLSVFPHIPAANPVLTLAALALPLANKLGNA
ncbi:MAG: GMC family oxidoreductase [Chloroflexota bacterium]|nr:GMC family oxidoreductase [Chloroflexota bacterium]